MFAIQSDSSFVDACWVRCTDLHDLIVFDLKVRELDKTENLVLLLGADKTPTDILGVLSHKLKVVWNAGPQNKSY